MGVGRQAHEGKRRGGRCAPALPRESRFWCLCDVDHNRTQQRMNSQPHPSINRRMPPSRERGPSSPLPPLSSLPLGSLLCSACPDSRSLLSGTQWLVRLVDHPPRPIAHPKRARPRLELSADVTARSCPALPTHRALMPHHQKTAVPRRTAVVTRSKASDQERQDHAAQRCRLDE